MARSRMRSTNARATLKLTSASSSAMRTSRRPASTSSLLSLPRPLRRRKTSVSRSASESNIALRAPPADAQRGDPCLQPGLDGVAASQLGGVPEALLHVRQLGQRTADEVVGAAAADAERHGELGVRPVL